MYVVSTAGESNAEPAGSKDDKLQGENSSCPEEDKKNTN